MHLRAGALIAFALLGGNLQAKLDFPSPAIVLPAAPGQEILTGSFPFTNAGVSPVTILELKPGCGCTLPVLAKRTYLPGESGQIEVRFAVGEREGHQEKLLAVRTDEPSGGIYSLTLKADIPPYLGLSPRLLIWHQGDAPGIQTVSIHYPSDAEYRLTSISEPTGRFHVSAVRRNADGLPQVDVAPTATDSARLGTVIFNFIGPNGRTLTRSVYLRILGSP